MSAKGMSPADPIVVRIYKKESELELWKRDGTGRYALLKTYPLCRWSGKLGPKKQEGDRQAPEGFYAVSPGQMNPKSQFYLSFNLGYPNRLERALGYQGHALMVHGACTSSGCYAMTDDGIAEIYAVAREAFAAGQESFQVQAMPFRMTPRNFARHRNECQHSVLAQLETGNGPFRSPKAAPRSFGMRWPTPVCRDWPRDDGSTGEPSSTLSGGKSRSPVECGCGSSRPRRRGNHTAIAHRTVDLADLC